MRRFPLLSVLLIGLLALLPLPSTQAQRAAQQKSAAATVAAKSATSVATISAAVREAADSNITAAHLKEYLYFVASDEMAGRDTPSAGLDATAKFIADKLPALKIKPAGDGGTYFQRIELHSYKTDPATTKAEWQGRALKFGEEFVTGNDSGQASGSLVYVGHGYVVKSKNIDAYQGLDVRGKILVVAVGVMPKGVQRSDLKGKAGTGDWEDAETYGRKNGAVGIVALPRNLERVYGFLQRRGERDSFEVARFQESGRKPIPAIIPSVEIVKSIFAGEKQGGEAILKSINDRETGDSFSLSPDKKLSFTVSVTTKTATTQNVVGVLEGSDKTLKKEYVAIGAHYDHVGVGRADKNGDTIYNGADDDGSGTVSVLTIAEAFAHGPRPKRSILFVWHCGEEKGLWGSQYFTEYPTIPLKQVVAQLNIDMIGRSKKAGDTNAANKELSGENEIYVIGSKEMSTELGELSERVNREYLNVKFNYLYDDPKDPNRFFYRSDHFNYAKHGIPIIFYFDGEHEDYHRPSDSPDKIDYQKMERIARTVFATGQELANAPKRPTVDKPLSPERAGNR